MLKTETFEVKTELGTNNSLSDAFFNLGLMIKSCNDFDRILMNKYGYGEYKTYLDLAEEGIKKGSVKAFVRRVIEIDDKDIEEKGSKVFFNSFLKEAKKSALKFLNEPADTRDNEKLKEELKDEARKNNINPEPLEELMVGNRLIEPFTEERYREQTQKFIVGGQEISIPRLNLTHDTHKKLRENNNVRTVMNEEALEKLKIRIHKPDYQGKTFWDINYFDKENGSWESTKGKFIDEEWLKEYQEERLLPENTPSPKSYLIIEGKRITKSEINNIGMNDLFDEDRNGAEFKNSTLQRIEIYNVIEVIKG
ncbi:MAG: hypothetical protein ACTSXQ_07725 [Alphaproteobacteria bacterium]